MRGSVPAITITRRPSLTAADCRSAYGNGQCHIDGRTLGECDGCILARRVLRDAKDHGGYDRKKTDPQNGHRQGKESRQLLTDPLHGGIEIRFLLWVRHGRSMEDDDIDSDFKADSNPASAERYEITIDAPGRVDQFLAQRLPDVSRTRVKGLIKAGAVELNGAPLSDAARRVGAGDVVRVAVPPPAPAAPAPESIPLDVLHEDAELVVVNKPAGMVVHPAAGHGSGTLVNALIAHCGSSLSGIGGVSRPGIVHRLDKDTSGVMVVAKTDRAHRALSEQFADHGRTGPVAQALRCPGMGAPRTGVGADRQANRPACHGPATVCRARRWKACCDTLFCDNIRGSVVSRLDCALETGRTHQIRVHMASIGHPLLGDALYGAGFATKAVHLSAPARECLAMLGRQALHARHLAFEHPVAGTVMAFDAALPPDMATLTGALGLSRIR